MTSHTHILSQPERPLIVLRITDAPTKGVTIEVVVADKLSTMITCYSLRGRTRAWPHTAMVAQQLSSKGEAIIVWWMFSKTF